MIKFNTLPTLLLSLIIIFSCNTNENHVFDEEAYRDSLHLWKQQRLKDLKSEEGWLNIVGLHWIEEGLNEFGSHKDNKIIFPADAPEFIGAIIKFKGNLSISVNDSIEVFVKGSLIRDYDILTDASEKPTLFKMGKYQWHIIERNGKYAVRLRNLQSPKIDSLKEIPYFQIDTKWRVEAAFERFEKPTELEIMNILGISNTDTCFGLLSFNINDKNYKLYPLGNGIKDNLFLMFGDETNTIETYGGGRYLYVNKPNSLGKTIIDFNKAFNPPCAFSEFATCPLPPKENLLNIRVTAGEKTVEAFKH